MSQRVFVDTGAWVATAVKTDGLHRAAAQTMKELVRAGHLLVTSDYVLSETVTRLRYDAGHSSAMRFLQAFDAAEGAGQAVLLQIDESIFAEARRIFAQYEDQDFSFVDCTSFALMQSRGIDTAFAFDHHFFVMGFSKLP